MCLCTHNFSNWLPKTFLPFLSERDEKTRNSFFLFTENLTKKNWQTKIVHHSPFSVSYTHLDVYKRQSDINSKVLAFAFGLSAEIERNLISQRTKEALARKKAEGVLSLIHI